MVALTARPPRADRRDPDLQFLRSAASKTGYRHVYWMNPGRTRCRAILKIGGELKRGPRRADPTEAAADAVRILWNAYGGDWRRAEPFRVKKPWKVVRKGRLFVLYAFVRGASRVLHPAGRCGFAARGEAKAFYYAWRDGRYGRGHAKELWRAA